MKTSSFYSTDAQSRKNGRRICPINDAPAWTLTLATPQKPSFSEEVAAS